MPPFLSCGLGCPKKDQEVSLTPFPPLFVHPHAEYDRPAYEPEVNSHAQPLDQPGLRPRLGL